MRINKNWNLHYSFLSDSKFYFKITNHGTREFEVRFFGHYFIITKLPF